MNSLYYSLQLLVKETVVCARICSADGINYAQIYCTPLLPPEQTVHKAVAKESALGEELFLIYILEGTKEEFNVNMSFSKSFGTWRNIAKVFIFIFNTQNLYCH